MRARYWAILGAAIVALIAGVTAAVAKTSSAVASPSSMAATGDSITRAFDLDAGHPLVDSPQESWSTGSDPAVNSQYSRIHRGNPSIGGHALNDAKSGAKMVDLDGQVKAAAAQGVGYLTILMGGNDLCTSSAATMTPTATFRAEFSQALSDFFQADPKAHVLVSSIPNIYQLWNTLHANLAAQTIWTVAHICQSMLALTNTDADRQQVVQQELADNAVLAAVCKEFANCKWDNRAVYNVNFTPAAVSNFDYFHPSLTGQQILADVTWRAGYWPVTP